MELSPESWGSEEAAAKGPLPIPEAERERQTDRLTEKEIHGFSFPPIFQSAISASLWQNPARSQLTWKTEPSL